MPVTLADFPAHRRDELLHRHDSGPPYLRCDPDQLDQMVREATGGWCEQLWKTQIDTVTAELGDDGRYHLRINELPCLGGNLRGKQPSHNAAVWPHRHWCRWRAAERWPDAVEFYYEVRPTGSTIDPTHVPRQQRCPAQYAWPPYRFTRSSIGAVVRTLLDTFGLSCQCCRRGFGMFVDHDHYTGKVRGLVCHDCNTRMERCLHLDGCLYAEYLNEPPAAELDLHYPRKRR